MAESAVVVHVYVVTHGEKCQGENPRMTVKGMRQMRLLEERLPRQRSEIVCGTGKRHFGVLLALALSPTRITAVVGGPDSLEIIGEEKKIVLAGGKKIDPDIYTTVKDLKPAALALVAELPHNTIVAAGRPFMKMLGHKDPRDAAVYEIRVVAVHGELVDLDIAELACAGGETEKGGA